MLPGGRPQHCIGYPLGMVDRQAEREIERLTQERDGWRQHADHLHAEQEAIIRDHGLYEKLRVDNMTAELHAALAREATLRRQVEELERELERARTESTGS